MKQYLELLNDILVNGYDHGDRTGTGRRSVIGRTLRFDMKDGFPLVTTRKIPTNAFIKEMLWFIEGQNDNRLLTEQKVNIWNQWALSAESAEELIRLRRPDITSEEVSAELEMLSPAFGSIGPIYGPNWRMLPRARDAHESQWIPYQDIPAPTRKQLHDGYEAFLAQQESTSKILGVFGSFENNKTPCLSFSSRTGMLVTSSTTSDRHMSLFTIGNSSDLQDIDVNGVLKSVSVSKDGTTIAAVTSIVTTSVLSIYKLIDEKWQVVKIAQYEETDCVNVEVNDNGTMTALTVCSGGEYGIDILDQDLDVILIMNSSENAIGFGTKMYWVNLNTIAVSERTAVDGSDYSESELVVRSIIDGKLRDHLTVVGFDAGDVNLDLGFSATEEHIHALPNFKDNANSRQLMLGKYSSETIAELDSIKSMDFLSEDDIITDVLHSEMEHLYFVTCYDKETKISTINLCSIEKSDESTVDVEAQITAAYNRHIDQLNNLVLGLKSNPYSSRHIVSSWIPTSIPTEAVSPQENVLLGNGALAPCHCMFQCFVRPGENGSKDMLSLEIKIRSSDVPVGLPYNIAQYALLLEMLARTVDMEANELIVTLGDAHIYLNQIDVAKEQIKRGVKTLSKLTIKDTATNIFEMTANDIVINDYSHCDVLKYEVSV